MLAGHSALCRHARMAHERTFPTSQMGRRRARPHPAIDLVAAILPAGLAFTERFEIRKHLPHPTQGADLISYSITEFRGAPLWATPRHPGECTRHDSQCLLSSAAMWSWHNIDWTATSMIAAAWAQAILSAGAVAVASRLQDRAVKKRDIAGRNRKLDGVAAIARYANNSVQASKDRLSDGMLPAAVEAILPDGCLQAPSIAIGEIKVSELGDVELVGHALQLINAVHTVGQAFGRLKASARAPLTMGSKIDARSALGNAPTDIFNSAAAVERRIAQIVGREALL